MKTNLIVIIICIIPAVGFIFFLLFIESRKRHFKKARSLITERPKTNAFLIDYSKYEMTGKEKAKYILIAYVALFGIGYVFFRNIFICVMISMLAFIYPSLKKKDIIKRRKSDLSLQFRDALQSLSASLSAGKSVESAFKSALEDLKMLYPDKNTYIIREFELINRKVDMNETLQSALADFAARADIDDITNFVDVFTICKSTGGNLVEVIKNTSSVINQKIEIKNEIEVIVAEQKFNQKILTVMPFGLLLLIISSSPDYVKPLYSPKGNIVMFIVLSLLALAHFIGEKIMDIKV